MVTLLDGVMQRKEMYEQMRQHMMGLFSAHQGDEQRLLKSFCIERGKCELLVYLTEHQLRRAGRGVLLDALVQRGQLQEARVRLGHFYE